MRVLGAAAVLFLGLCAPASAGTVSVQPQTHEVLGEESSGYDVVYDTVVFHADRGETNDVVVQIVDGTATIRDGVPLSAGSGCSSTDTFTATCAVRSPAGAPYDDAEMQPDVALDLGDGNDSARLFLQDRARSLVSGGDGDDRLEGGTKSRDILLGGPGADYLDGKGTTPGMDGDVLRGGTGPDTLLGPEGTEVDYSDHTQPVHVDFDGDRDDGSAGEGDLVGPYVTNALGGSGADELVGNDRANDLHGGPGADLLIGAGGPDLLSGDGGADRVLGGSGDDALYLWDGGIALGGDGNDELYGGPGTTLDGGAGDDRLTGTADAQTLIGGPGRDTINGAGGADRIEARDGSFDDIRCDPWPRRPAGTAVEDGLDFSTGCAAVERLGAAVIHIFPRGVPVYDAKPRHTHAQVGCPDDHPPRCTGVLRAFYDGALIGRSRFSVPAGRVANAGVRIHSAELDRELARVGEAGIHLVLRSADSRGRTRLRRTFLDYRRY